MRKIRAWWDERTAGELDMTDHYHEGHEIEDIKIGIVELSSDNLEGTF